MDTSPPPPSSSGAGRRDNGLPSAEWGALVDVDPRLSEALLASLGAAGVPAYVEPAGGLDAVSRAAQLPARPLDRLWVDPVRADAAREVVGAEVADLTMLLAELEPGATAHGFVLPVPSSAATRVLSPPVLPGPPGSPIPAPAPDDPDEAWRQIVAGFDREADQPVPPWPVTEDVDPPSQPSPNPPGRSGEPADGAPPRHRRRTDAPEARDALPDWVEPEALEDEGHYVPPPPPPVPRVAPRTLAAVAAIVVGLLLLFVPQVVDVFQLSPAGVFLVGLTLLLGGAATVILLMRDAPPTDSGPDDGAVV